MSDPLVSVVITTYNRENYIKRAVQSALKQTYKNMEIIIVDDGSTDRTPEILSKFQKENSNIIILTNKTNIKNAKSANRGVRSARGKYIARLDDDDFWCDSQKVKKQVAFLEKNKEYVVVGGGVIKIDKYSKEITRYLLPENDEDIKKKILSGHAIAHVTTLFKKGTWEKVGGYDEHFDALEDWELWPRMGMFGKFYNIQEFLTSFSDHGRDDLSYVEKRHRRIKRLKLGIELVKKHRNNYPGYKRAFLYCWLRYFYSFLPFKNKLWPIVFKLRDPVR